LDGVDEAAGWEPGADLFPLPPPEGVRVVLSARYFAGDANAGAWLRRLGWDAQGVGRSSELPILTLGGIADVLQRMDRPLEQLSTHVDMVAELRRLSEGDPLLVRLYVDDLWALGEAAVRLQPEELRHIHPGLSGYFERWWDDQRRLWGDEQPLRDQAVQTVLNLLACALGPLSREDLLALAPRETGLTGWATESVLLSLARIIVGDGSREQGYVFSHPRLGTYISQKLSAQERRAIESRILAWGEATLVALNEGRLLPEQASPYLVQYYSTHLERANRKPDDLILLVSNSWQQA
jgi:hypothetical protein